MFYSSLELGVETRYKVNTKTMSLQEYKYKYKWPIWSYNNKYLIDSRRIKLYLINQKNQEAKEILDVNDFGKFKIDYLIWPTKNRMFFKDGYSWCMHEIQINVETKEWWEFWKK